MASICLPLNHSKTEFLVNSQNSLNKSRSSNYSVCLYNDVILLPSLTDRNLKVIVDNNITFSDHISAVFRSGLNHIRDLGGIRNTIDRTSACTMTTSLVHSRLDYCNSLLLNFPSTQTNRLQLVLNVTARAVTKTHTLTMI